MKKFIQQNKSFRIVIFFVAILLIAYGGTTLCQFVFDINHGTGWNGVVATRFSSGTGTESSPYHVKTPGEFAYIQTGCRNGVYIVLDNDIVINPGLVTNDGMYRINNNYYYIDSNTYKYYSDANLTHWVGNINTINATTSTMSCHIDGQGYSVYGLVAKEVNGVSTLFNNFTNGEIKNLNIKYSVFEGQTANIINNATNSKFENLYFGSQIYSEGTVPTQTQTQTLAQKVIADSATNTSTMAVDTENNGAVNYRYIGRNPNNYVCLGDTSSNCANGEKYRIIGVFSDDTHGVTGKKLVKLVRANYLGGDDRDKYNDWYIFDATRRGVAGNNTSKLFLDWSDAQLMYMLNGTDYMNSGYKLGASAPMHNWTNTNGNISDGSTIFYKSNGSYLYGGGSVNEPIEVTSGNAYVPSVINIPGLNASARDLIQEVTWHTGTASCINTSIKGLYVGERGANNNAGYCDYWIGKVGMPSISDVMYATSGGNYGANRSRCINFGDSDSYTYTYECDSYNWLTPDVEFYTLSYNDAYELFEGWTTQWYDDDTVWVYEDWEIMGYYFNGYPIKNTSDIWWYQVYPSVYLKENVSIVSGNGTSSSPYILSIPTETPGSSTSSSLINNSTNCTYNQILAEGGLISNIETVGFIRNSNSDTANNIQINMEHHDININAGSSAPKTTIAYAFSKNATSSNFDHMYSSGYTHVKSMYYFNVPMTNSFVGNYNSNATNPIPITSVPDGCYQTVSSSYPNYKTKEELYWGPLDMGFMEGYWMMNGLGYPTLRFYKPDIGIWVANVDETNGGLYTYGTNFDRAISSWHNFYYGPYAFSLSYISNIIGYEYADWGDQTTQVNGYDGLVEYGYYNKIDKSVIYGTDMTDHYPNALLNYGFHRITYDFYTVFNTVYSTKSGHIFWELYNRPVTYYQEDPNGTVTQIDTTNQNQADASSDMLYVAGYYTHEDPANAPIDLYGTIKLDCAPVGTILTLSYNGGRYTYTVKSGDQYIPLSSFKKEGTASTIYYDGILRNDVEYIYLTFPETVGGPFKSSLIITNQAGDFIKETPSDFFLNVIASSNPLYQTEMLTITNNSTTTFDLNTVGTYKNIRYSFTSTNSTNRTYNLVLNLLDSNERIISGGPITGMSFTYNGHTYRADDTGTVVIPIGSFVSSATVKAQVDYLNSTIDPGTYFLAAKIVDEQVASSYSKATVKTNYINIPDFDEIISAKITGSSSFAYGQEVTLSIDINYELENRLYSIKPTVKIYKKNQSNNTYSLISTSGWDLPTNTFHGSNTNDIGVAKYEIKSNQTISPGTYKIIISYTYKSSVIGTNEVYFIVK